VILFKRKTTALAYQVKLRFMINQKDNFNEITYLKDMLNMLLTHRKGKKNIISDMYRIELNSFIKVPLIVEYISKFNLKTKKKESFIKWNEVLKLVLNKEHLNIKGLESIRKLSKEVNIITSLTNKTGSKNK
jgi:hypothetical protein